MARLCPISVWFRYLHVQTPLRNSQLFCRTSFTGRGLGPQPRASSAATRVYLLRANRIPPSSPAVRSASTTPQNSADVGTFSLIYRFPGIKYCRMLSRLKLLQTGLTSVLLPPVYYYYVQGQVTATAMAYCTGTAVFAAVMLYCLSHYFRRIIGMMYINTPGTTLKVSHLTFWGKRRDIFIPVEDVKTLTETGDSRNETVFQLQRYSSPDVLYFTTRYGRVLDRERFIMVFGKFS